MDELEQTDSAGEGGHSGMRIFGWVVLGMVIGLALVAAFLAYGQPELLLEQLNLRYCG